MVAKKLANSPLTFSPKRCSVSERFGLHAGHRFMDDAVDVALRFLQERNVVFLAKSNALSRSACHALRLRCARHGQSELEGRARAGLAGNPYPPAVSFDD